MLIKCTAKACKYNQNGICTSKIIEMIDVEEQENIKFKDEDFMVCKTFEFRC
ncbi:DUF1540 domain-containing protein [Clostridium botulinum]|uniref:DUF1540 domain-containing protein n=1 Tax=Clostridium botulinum TaxID=1491 RepID=UPI0009B2F8F0|nr:DUF1540 domain-containing protein [Clostridium botulinum]MCS6110418.1 DUF1540 domain-containing protein [Clostridium botulinum]NFE13581.1 DUF1540 domain-containing protein [Clostridium botulinum]NFE83141.1 DUF1540 domain-containing protein [Clostridium botulinum]NFG37510.1 DUF1540 domain-containing protein [Clostridium botulinum]NFL41467.1 DUF1540 domain-containing protein [Clostridium botulinum]